MQDTDIALQHRGEVGLPDRSAVASLEPDAAPGADDSCGGRPSRRAAEDGGAEPAQLLVRDHGSAPTWPWPPLLELRVQGAETERQLVGGRTQERGDFAF